MSLASASRGSFLRIRLEEFLIQTYNVMHHIRPLRLREPRGPCGIKSSSPREDEFSDAEEYFLEHRL